MSRFRVYKYYTFFIVLISYSFISTCCAQDSYSFIVAGHTYGTPNKKIDGLHLPFIKHLIDNSEEYKFGVFTGDIVKYTSEKKWDIVQQQLELVCLKTYFTPGNHDMGNRRLYKRLNGIADTCFLINDDAFLLFDNTKNGWNMDSLQLELFNYTLENLSANGRLFVFGHNVLWQDKYDCAISNSKEGQGPVNLFWVDVMPKLSRLSNQIYWFAGDVGANYKTKNVSYIKEDNIHLIASGMGNNINDNYLKVNVDDTSITIDVIPLNGKLVQPITDFNCN